MVVPLYNECHSARARWKTLPTAARNGHHTAEVVGGQFKRAFADIFRRMLPFPCGIRPLTRIPGVSLAIVVLCRYGYSLVFFAFLIH